MADEVEVSYSVKELLKQISDRLDNFMILLASKADQSSVTRTDLRIDELDTRLLTIEKSLDWRAQHSNAKREFRRWIVPVMISAGTVGVLLLQVFHIHL